MLNAQGCTKVTEDSKLLSNFELPINAPNGDQHYLVCTLTLSYGKCKCGHCVSPLVTVSNPISGQVMLADVWHAADEGEVASLFEMAQKIDQQELLGWFE